MANVTLDPAIIRGEQIPNTERQNYIKRVTLIRRLFAALPPDCEIVFVGSHGTTNWAKGLKVKAKVDGEELAYFLKV
ncbi:hypothetical protein IMZ48_49110 [Candidatus Bathyarchaeota archaeon]|nr:hypothetical protein [Candidatus Bathyarchaeota archaeon]